MICRGWRWGGKYFHSLGCNYTAIGSFGLFKDLSCGGCNLVVVPVSDLVRKGVAWSVFQRHSIEALQLDIHLERNSILNRHRVS